MSRGSEEKAVGVMMSLTQWPSMEEDVGAEEVAAVFRAVTFAVLAATSASIGMVAILVTLGFASAVRGTLFCVYLCVFSSIHILLRRLYSRDAARGKQWRWWGRAFTAVALMEGMGWGWTSYGLVSYDNFQAQVLCLLTSGGVAVASIPVFGAYRPAFLVFFISASFPFVITGALSHGSLERGMALLALNYFIAMLIFGLSFNRSFRRLVRLRIHAETLASDLRDQIEVAEAANRAKSSFLAAASHDLRQPVHAVGLFIGALRGMTMSAEAMAVIEQIEASSQAMDALFASLLDISRLDAGIVEVNRKVFAIGPMLDRICFEHANDARDKGLRLRVHPSSAFVQSDPILIERILRNLVSNAVRYTPRGRVVVGCRRRGAALDVQVWDTGLGIPANQRERIFEEYYQLGNVERDRTKGLGLGLAIVRRLTKLLACDLTLTSVIGQGSCFAIAIPLASRAAIVDEVAGEVEPLSLRAQTIVVIDDEADIRAAMSLVLERWGHTVFAVSSTREAIDRLAYHPVCPDLIISDFRLRDHETGIDAIEALCVEYNMKIPAILITGDTAPERLAEARNSGLLLLHKPVSNGRLRAAIANLKGKHRDSLSPGLGEQAGVPSDARRLSPVDDVERFEN